VLAGFGGLFSGWFGPDSFSLLRRRLEVAGRCGQMTHRLLVERAVGADANGPCLVGQPMFVGTRSPLLPLRLEKVIFVKAPWRRWLATSFFGGCWVSNMARYTDAALLSALGIETPRSTDARGVGEGC